MHRLMKALLLMVAFVLVGQIAMSQSLPIVQVSGRLPQGALRVFTKDNLYQIVGQYTVAGMLVIEPGTTIEFVPNGRLIDSVGGKIIADGELQATWNGNTSVGSYCDPAFIRSNVAIGGRPEITAPGTNWTNFVPYLLFYYGNGLDKCATDPNLRNRPYRRNIVRAPIIFRGRPLTQYSREWGHIVILPGADSAIFRNCQFVNFRKDTSVVQSTDFYAPNNATGYNAAQVAGGNALNILMRQVTSGGGGAITVFSSKTWILNCRFDSNFARYHGGAVQFLQAPFDASGQFYLPAPGLPVSSTAYPPVDPETYDTYGGTNTGDSISTPFGSIPNMATTTPSNPAMSQFRQTYDDGRAAINKGRVRRIYFRDNRAVVSDIKDDAAGYRDVITPAPLYPVNGIRKNEAYGGAVYVSGRRGITIFFGRALGDPTDTIVCERNYAVNYQNATGTNGARGGAFYIGDSSSMVFRLSRFADNFTAVPNVGESNYAVRSQLSQGGGIYMSRTSPTLTIGSNVDFRNNKSGQGGAIYVSAIAVPTSDPFLSPNLLGDSVMFVGNKAEYDGGAIYSQRNILVAAPLLTSIDSSAAGRPTVDHRALLDRNAAGLSGGAVVVDNQTNSTNSTARIENALFSNNVVGDSASVTDTRLIKLYDPVANPFSPAAQFGVMTVSDSFRMSSILIQDVLGGAAIYSFRGNTNYFRSVEFNSNWTYAGNGGAVAMVVPITNNRYFLSAGDSSYNFTLSTPGAFASGPEPTDQRQMTRFINNRAVKDTFNLTSNANPRPQQGTTGPLDPGRNGTGLGGAIYINDLQPTNPTPGAPRTDSVIIHRVRIERNTAYSGSAIYSPNYDLRVILNKSLVANNVSRSPEGYGVDVIPNLSSPGASLTASATFFGDIEGPMPTATSSVQANAIYDNQARFLVRLPDAPPGGFGTGASGVDTLRGNFWGEVQAPVTTVTPSGTLQNTFYVQGLGCTLPLKNPANVNEQGPFESTRQVGDPSNFLYAYTPIPVGVIPDTLLFEGRVYDIFDKGRDIKSADYSSPRMAPIEDFSVGIPKRLSTFATGVHAGKVVRRMTRDPFVADVNSTVSQLQREFVGNHPIGYPLFLESNANYAGMADTANNDANALNYTTFFVINVETGEMIRTNLKQVAEGRTVFRSRVEFVADSINRDPLERRSREGRASFSVGELYRLSPRYYLETPGALPALGTALDSLKTARFYAARYEDSISIPGRRYGDQVSNLGGPGFSFTNRPTSPTFVDIYAGERYHALPVKTGDRIWVISRTMLWNTDAPLVTVLNNARFTGLQFTIDTIGNSVAAPIVYGQRDQLEAKTPAELRNTRFLNEDSVYKSDPTGRAESKIFEVTASDPNGFFDPRSIYFPNQYTGLRYEWSPLQELTNGTTVPSTDPSQVRLASWLHAESVFPGVNRSNRDSAHARGFLRFYGTPHNPDVVPGGELVELKVSNYPPGVRTIDSLRGLLPVDSLANWIYIYPPYFNCQTYDPTVARYLQQDTVDVGGATTTTYRFRIFVQDSMPVFQPDVTPCSFPNLPPNTVVANLTNKLRFDFDVNTDDEAEDNAVANSGERWDFRYGRTTYGFVFTDRNYGGGPGVETDDVYDIRPTWLADSNLMNDNHVKDQGLNLMTNGKIVVRIDSSVALGPGGLLRNPAQFNNAFNLDSIFTIVVNDGHTGQNKRDMRVLINVAPQLQPLVSGGFTLPAAKEDFDYNPALLDSTRMIPVTDLNFNQRARFYLVYASDGDNDPRWQTGFSNTDSNGASVTNTATLAHVRRDACYTEAGLFDAPKTTPSWLKINPVSGMLYGTPGLNDAPMDDSITVVVEDEFGLTDVRVYKLHVDSTSHAPVLHGLPPIQCVDANQPYRDSLCVSDRDLGRTGGSKEQLTLSVIGAGAGSFQVSPATINGTLNPDTCYTIFVTANSIADTGIVNVQVRVVDAAGNSDTLAYRISVSAPTLFTMPIEVSNTYPSSESRPSAFQRLVFGYARNATTGEESAAIGQLDADYCEYELPPQPPADVFDARWVISGNAGTLRDIFPDEPTTQPRRLVWKGSFQPGNLTGSGANYPIIIRWKMSDAQKSVSKDLYLMDPSEALFRVNMKNGQYKAGGGITVVVSNDTVQVQIGVSTNLTGFKITWDPSLSGVTEPTPGMADHSSYTLSPNVPNPFSQTTHIGFNAPKRGAVKLEIFDIHGSLVATLLDGDVEAGYRELEWNGTDASGKAVASGTYTYRLTAGETVLTRTMVLMK